MSTTQKIVESAYRSRTSSGLVLHVYAIPYSGKFSREKTFANFEVESHPRKFSPRNLGRAAPTYDCFQAIRERFLREILTSYGSAKVFSLKSLPLYDI